MAKQVKQQDWQVERTTPDEPGAVDKIRQKSSTLDHLMRMNDRFGDQGGNQFSAAITYFSVMAVIPLAMLIFAIAAMVLAGNPHMLQTVRDSISGQVPGDTGNLVNQVIDQAINQRGAVAGIGALTALWSGLGWMNNLRTGISEMWKVGPSQTEGGFVKTKLRDLVALLGLIIAFFLAFAVTAIGSSSLTMRVLKAMGVEGFPGLSFVLFLIGLVVGLVANFLVMWWILAKLPRTRVPRKSGIYAAMIGAVLMEVIKQFSTLIFGALLGNPAGAVFGPVIGLMLIFYFLWRVVMYLSAWAATTDESLRIEKTEVPAPAVIHVRNEVKTGVDQRALVGVGAGIGAAAAGAVAWVKNRRR